MSHTISAAIGKPFGLQRVCRVLDFPRSTICAERARAASNLTRLAPARRGPKPKVPDHELLAAIRADSVRTPFVGEGARKVWARLRVLDEIRVSRTRVSRLMRETAYFRPIGNPKGRPMLTMAASRRIGPTRCGAPT